MQSQSYFPEVAGGTCCWVEWRAEAFFSMSLINDPQEIQLKKVIQSLQCNQRGGLVTEIKGSLRHKTQFPDTKHFNNSLGIGNIIIVPVQ